ncbi:MAG: hypothetical protein JKY94_00740 [Rhodobacteraceae bacterium]|nr:hypothetical protein [Paracoccaceae bacterium]
MFNSFKLKSKCNYFLRDTRGSFAMMWAVSMMGILLSVGAAYDLAQVSKAKSLAQIAADNMALAASVAVDLDNASRYQANHAYPYREIGGAKDDFTGTITGKVQYDIVDDGDVDNTNLPANERTRLLARARVSGTYTTAFMGILPGLETIEFSAVSDVTYAAREGKPASIFFVTDNSGSMNSKDANNVRKINSLKDSMVGFMDILKGIDLHGKRIFRTALFPYSTNLITSKVVNPAWGTLTDGSINLMRASGGTRSTSALTKASAKFNVENGIHNNANGEDEPLKFLIFMSDGANNGASTQQVCTPQQVWVPGNNEYWWKRKKNGQVKYKYSRPKKPWKWNYVRGTQGYWGTQQVCESVPYSAENESSLEKCTTMKNNGVKIYAIAYDVSAHERAMAETFMKECSSGVDEFYKYATSGADLQAVFEQIGESIVKEVVRIKR